MRFHLPPLTSLRAFEAAARHESFTRAAEELAVTHGAVSRQIAHLEAWLGHALFERLHKSVRLNERGSRLRDELTASFMRISAATDAARRRSRGTVLLRVSAPPAFSVRWLIPRLGVFQRAHPGIEVSLSNSVAAPDFHRDEYDLAIRRMSRRPSNHYATRLFAEVSVPICHVDLVEGVQCPLHPRDLLQRFRLLRVAHEPRGWAKWAKVWGVDIASARFVDVEHTYLAVQAALEGLGVALLPLALASDDMFRGVLVAPAGATRLDASSYYVFAAKAPARASAERLIMDWLLKEAQAPLPDLLPSKAGR
jgi:LysR family glycine cleavage system transcriptional activator